MPSCSQCSGPSASFRCAQCLETVYCNTACQKAHWKAGHKGECAESLAKVKARSAGLLAHGAMKEAVASALSVRELQAELRARGIPSAGLLEKADLVRALVCAPLLPQAPAPAAAQSEAELDAQARQDMARLFQAGEMSAVLGGRQSMSFEDLVGKDAAGRIGAAYSRSEARQGAAGGGGGGGASPRGAPSRVGIMTGNGMVEAEADITSPLSREEFLDLCRRTGRNSPTPGDAMTYGLLFMRLVACLDGDQEQAHYAVAAMKATDGNDIPPAVREKMLRELLGEEGTTRGLKRRITELVAKVESSAGKSRREVWRGGKGGKK